MKINNECYQRRGCIFNFITALARIFGLITFAGLGYVAYLEWLGIGSWNFRIYVTVVTIIVAYLEVLWILDKCVTCCICCFRFYTEIFIYYFIGSETCFYWMCCIPIDNWRKTIVYIGLSIPFFVPTWLFLTIRTDINIVGILLVILGLLYLIKTFKYKRSHFDEVQEDDTLFETSNSLTRPSISTQTSSMGINNDNLSSVSTVNQEINPKH